MSLSPGHTTAQIRDLVHEYELLPYGRKGSWLQEQGISPWRIRLWRAAVFDGDLDRGLIPREGSAMSLSPAKRTALENQRARERAAHEVERERLIARVRELEETNEALGKAIGLLHTLSAHEPDELPKKDAPSSSSPPSTHSSPS